MQYVLKLTPLGIEHHVFRVVSVDGLADTEHVLNLCNLSFGYGNYDSKELIFAKDAAAFKALSVDSVDEDDDHYGPTGNEFAAFWQDEPKLEGLELLTIQIKSGSQEALKRFDILLESMSEMLSSNEFAAFWQDEPKLEGLELLTIQIKSGSQEALKRFDILLESMSEMLSSSDKQSDGVVNVDECVSVKASNACKADTHPGDQNFRFKFIYVLNGVKHLVEVMMSSEKLNCFLPATLMGDGLIVDDNNDRQLSIAMLNEIMASHENDEAAEDGLNLKECTSRMRALGAMRGAQKINDALLKAGAEPLSFSHENDEAAEDGLNLKECTSRMRALGAMRGAQKINDALLKAGAEPLSFKVDQTQELVVQLRAFR